MTGADRSVALAVWIFGLVLCAALVAGTRISTDMSAFLPRSPSAAQQVLVDQVRNGVVSRLVLLGIDGAPPDTLADLSRALAAGLRRDAAFLAVDNGEEGALAGERDFVWRNRYLLSPTTRPDRFTATGLHRALDNDLQLLRSDLAVLVKHSLPADPTGQILALADELAGPTPPHSRDGVWFSPDERRAVLLVQTRAPGFDIDAQQRNLALIENAFAAAKRDVSGAASARLVDSGPAVFAVRTRATMERDATRFSLFATIVVAGLLFFAYRSLRVLLLGLLPVASGALAGIAVVALGFGFVHGITLGFGVTLIGESVDYAIYLFTQTEPGSSPADTLARIWTTLRLGMLTSVAGFSAMLFSSFAGFAQLGLFSIAGLLAALGVTRWVLPALLPRDFVAPSAGLFGAPLLSVMRRARRLALPAVLLVAASAALLLFHRGGFWQEDLASLSPIPVADQRLDRALRHDIGAPDVRYLVVLTAPGEQPALAASARVSALLEGLVARHALAGFDAPDRYLPSDATQRARQASLPPPELLERRLEQALAGLPFRAEEFQPFIRDVAAARAAPLLARGALPPALSLKLDSMLFERRGEWIAVLPLRGVADPTAVAEAVAAAHRPGVAFVDLKQESDRLLHRYEHEATLLALIGGLAVLALLAASLRSPARVLRVAAPLVASVVVTAALLSRGGRQLSIFNLVGLLLIVSVGSNYCLFFERQGRDQEHRERTVASLVLANLCTDFGFGILSLSGIPVLHDIGVTVAIGTLLSLVFAAILGDAGLDSLAFGRWKRRWS
jgi:predicted exporter